MPYIKEYDRDIDSDSEIDTPGQLNYLFTKIINDYLKNNGLSYLTINDCIGALEGAKLEFYRRVVAPMEDFKCKTNGDVYSKRLIEKYDKN